jgi:hypothetical protein
VITGSRPRRVSDIGKVKSGEMAIGSGFAGDVPRRQLISAWLVAGGSPGLSAGAAEQVGNTPPRTLRAGGPGRRSEFGGCDE